MGLVATGEFIYKPRRERMAYINANLPGAQTAFAGADTRPRWFGPACPAAGGVSPCQTRLNNQPAASSRRTSSC